MAAWLGPATQEKIAWVVVAVAAFVFFQGIFRRRVAGPLAAWLLRRGRVGLAMKVRSKAEGPGCGGCKG